VLVQQRATNDRTIDTADAARDTQNVRRNMDKQLLHYLQQRAKANQTQALVITHQQIADELHTHREAISRLLRTLEQKGIVKLGRNTIELL
jgi:CRP/FNR family transcriptional regulator